MTASDQFTPLALPAHWQALAKLDQNDIKTKSKILPAFVACILNVVTLTRTIPRKFYPFAVITVPMKWKTTTTKNNRLKTNNMSYFIWAIMLFIKWQCCRLRCVHFLHHIRLPCELPDDDNACMHRAFESFCSEWIYLDLIFIVFVLLVRHCTNTMDRSLLPSNAVSIGINNMRNKLSISNDKFINAKENLILHTK